MRLTPFDEYPFHQHPTPFHVPATSDVHFNDGYFCATFAQDWYLVCGIRLHPNMNVIDGFAGLARGGEQRTLRVSRVLRPAAGELTVGPLAIEAVSFTQSTLAAYLPRVTFLFFARVYTRQSDRFVN